MFIPNESTGIQNGWIMCKNCCGILIFSLNIFRSHSKQTPHFHLTKYLLLGQNLGRLPCVQKYIHIYGVRTLYIGCLYHLWISIYLSIFIYIYILIHISGWIRWNNSPNCQVSESPPGSTCPGPSHSSDQRGCSTPVRCKVHGTQGVSLRMCQDVGVSSIRNGRKPLNINQKMSQLVKRINQKSGETIWQKTNSKTPSSIQSFDEKNLPEPEVAIYLLGEESLCWHIQIV